MYSQQGANLHRLECRYYSVQVSLDILDNLLTSTSQTSGFSKSTTIKMFLVLGETVPRSEVTVYIYLNSKAYSPVFADNGGYSK